MTQDWNTAERERIVNSSEATEQQCFEMGRTHRAYGWARVPNGDWNEAQVAAYNKGFEVEA